MSPRTRKAINGYVCACGKPAVAIRDSAYVCDVCKVRLSPKDLRDEENKDREEHITRLERTWWATTQWMVNRGYQLVRDKKRATATIL